MLIEKIEQMLKGEGVAPEVIRIIRNTLDFEATKLYQTQPQYSDEINKILDKEVDRK